MIYLDASATTSPSPAAVLAMTDALRDCMGNPSSVYAEGSKAKKAMEEARETIRNSLGVRDAGAGHLFFTSGGTEADNLALNGTALAKSFKGRPRIITTAAEHPAVLEPLKRLAAQGFDVVTIPAPDGVLDREAFQKALTPETILTSVMLVNNETGAIQDVASLFAMAREACPGVVTHCDAVQGFGKIPCSPIKLGADLLSVSAHKIHGPKGIGALWVSSSILKAKKIVPILLGGGQEEGFRSGTENVPAILGFAAAAREAAEGREQRLAKTAALRERLIGLLPEGVTVNTPKESYLPQIVSLTLPRIRSEIMVRALSAEGIYVSAGSACASHHKGISHVLLDFGLDTAHADCTIRVSMDAGNTEEEIDRFAEALTRQVSSLQRTVR